ncbi:MAG TPA: MerR family transcriptional regulator [Hypericibacter adhaerens]|uniref:MerR family transcriptional regulator n=1 Tax=Hypericibacter adhaerens TaxID=2602016 RepID=UPI002CBE1001|nr:MerR family transcriptional regulator [Hypericibacter adhaerens]HWA42317.1 MerR family transcriptional regulator [Hypericibacter adhaerens]
MTAPPAFLNASEAAGRLGISIKALRLYEERGLLAPNRTAAGWRAYGPEAMSRAAEIAALRALGFSLAQVARVLKGDVQGLEPALAAHQAVLEGQIRELVGKVEKVRGLKDDLARGQAPTAGRLAQLAAPAAPRLRVAFDLPWPWGGERLELTDIRALNHITGPLGSGKTRLAKLLAETLPDAAFLGLERLAENGAAARTRLEADPALEARVERSLAWLVEDGATASDALIALLAGLEAERPFLLVIDMLEQGLDRATQEALIAHLRRRGPGARPLFFLTRSSAILDLEAVGPDEAILFCPANHAPPFQVAPHPFSPGYEALASCLAPPEVRARTEGVIAWRPEVA